MTTQSEVEAAAKAISAVRQNTTDERASWANGEMDRPRCFAYATAALEAAAKERGERILIDKHDHSVGLKVLNWDVRGHNRIGPSYPSVYETLAPGEVLMVRRAEK